MTVKLTKAQKDFFQGYCESVVAGVMTAVLIEGGMEMQPEDMLRAIRSIDLTELRDAIGSEFLERCDFTEIKRVDKLMKSEEFQKVMAASAQVGVAVQEELLRVVGPLVPAKAE